jgi:hypothetical protein
MAYQPTPKTYYVVVNYGEEPELHTINNGGRGKGGRKRGRRAAVPLYAS